MCRSIKVLNNSNHSATLEEVEDASRQFVRKISGYNKPSKTNEKAFNEAIKEISRSSEKLLENLAYEK